MTSSLKNETHYTWLKELQILPGISFWEDVLIKSGLVSNTMVRSEVSSTMAKTFS